MVREAIVSSKSLKFDLGSNCSVKSGQIVFTHSVRCEYSLSGTTYVLNISEVKGLNKLVSDCWLPSPLSCACSVKTVVRNAASAEVSI